VDAKGQSRQLERIALQRELARARELAGQLRAAAELDRVTAEKFDTAKIPEKIWQVEHAVRLLELRLADLKPD
jgi:hypothetical protein